MLIKTMIIVNLPPITTVKLLALNMLRLNQTAEFGRFAQVDHADCDRLF